MTLVALALKSQNTKTVHIDKNTKLNEQKKK